MIHIHFIEVMQFLLIRNNVLLRMLFYIFINLKLLHLFYIIVFRLVRDVVANHKTTRYAGAATKVIQKKSPCLSIM